MYVCMYVCMYGCIYIKFASNIFIRVYLSVDKYIYQNIHVHYFMFCFFVCVCIFIYRI